MYKSFLNLICSNYPYKRFTSILTLRNNIIIAKKERKEERKERTKERKTERKKEKDRKKIIPFNFLFLNCYSIQWIPYAKNVTNLA